MKKFLIPLILSLLFVSCSNQNQTSTVNFTIPAETVEILLNETTINPDEPNFFKLNVNSLELTKLHKLQL